MKNKNKYIPIEDLYILGLLFLWEDVTPIVPYKPLIIPYKLYKPV